MPLLQSPTERQILDFMLVGAEDVDRGNFSRASTEQIATHFGIAPEVAYKHLDALARRKVLSKTRDVMRRHRGKHAVGWQLWEYVWRAGDEARAAQLEESRLRHMARQQAIAEAAPNPTRSHARANPRHPASKLYTSPDGGSVRLTWSPVNQTWLLLWPGDVPVERQQVLSRFDTWEEGDREARRISSASSGTAENPTGGDDPNERKKLVEMAIGRIFRLGSRPTQPGDVEEYERCRAIILNATDPVTLDWVPDYARDRNKGAVDNPLEVGRGTLTQHLRLHHYHGSLRITDLENAGKRGKKVKELVLMPSTLNDEEAEQIVGREVDAILLADMTYAQAVDYLEAQGKDEYRLEEQTRRGIDVEPAGTAINLEKKFDDGAIVKIDATPHDFLVVSSVPIVAPGKAAHGYRQDTLYHPRAKADGILFYGWLRDNLSKAGEMTIQDLMKVWDNLGVGYDYH